MESEVDHGIQTDCNKCRLPTIASLPTSYFPGDTDTASKTPTLIAHPSKIPTISDIKLNEGEINLLNPTTIRQEKEIAGENDVRLIIFEFDQTLSTMHLFGALVASVPSPMVPEPFASTALGQINRIQELDSIAHCPTTVSFLVETVFGGIHRIKELKAFLCALRSSGIELVVCPRGMVGAVRHCLKKLGIPDLFAEVYGRSDSYYGSTPYDELVSLEPLTSEYAALLGVQDQTSYTWNSRKDLIKRLKHEKNLTHQQVLFINNDPK